VRQSSLDQATETTQRSKWEWKGSFSWAVWSAAMPPHCRYSQRLVSSWKKEWKQMSLSMPQQHPCWSRPVQMAVCWAIAVSLEVVSAAVVVASFAV